MGNHDYFGAEGEPLVSMLRAAACVASCATRGSYRARRRQALARGDRRHVDARDDIDEGDARGPPGRRRPPRARPEPVRSGGRTPAPTSSLSGHTHGGQVGVPFLSRVANLATFGYRYNVGFYRRGQSVLYVHPGLGTTGPPMRLGVAPEVAILTLRAA